METGRQQSAVAVLGAGRMGTACAKRLEEQGWSVTRWSRSRADPSSAATALHQVVGAAEIVLLTLFDGAACADVVERCTGDLADGTLVVNLSTVGVGEARALAEDVQRAGGRYVHAPVIGSVPAVADGSLTVLLGVAAEEDDGLGAVRDVLSALGEVVAVGGVEAAAAAKLVANAVLGLSLRTLGEVRAAASRLRLDPDLTLTLLERSAIGGVVRAKRGRLHADEFEDADFTVAALIKDLTLAAPAVVPLRTLIGELTDAVEHHRLDPSDDVAVLAAPDRLRRPDDDALIGLVLADGVQAPDAVLAPLRSYATAHATGDAVHHRRAFLPTAHVEGGRDGRFVSWSVDEYCRLFTGRPAADESVRRRRVEEVSVSGTVGTARMTLIHGDDVFTDVFVLIRVDDEWRIANKAYHRSTAGRAQPS